MMENNDFDYRLALLTGVPVPIEGCPLVAHQPTIKEISMIGEKNFLLGVQTICLDKSMIVQDESVLSNTNNFQIFMMIMKDKTMAGKKKAVKLIFSLVFPEYSLIFTPRSLVFKKEDQSIVIDENNFEKIQNLFKIIFCVNKNKNEQETFNPANEKAKEIADKIMAGRKKVAELKGSAYSSIFSKYISILSIGLHLPKTVFLNYTMPMIYDSMERYTLYINWDLDIRSRLAGGTPNSQPDDWMKDIQQNN